jgi:hypothetical protein
MQQRYYDPIAGRFLSMDPISTDADTGANSTDTPTRITIRIGSRTRMGATP